MNSLFRPNYQYVENLLQVSTYFPSPASSSIPKEREDLFNKLINLLEVTSDDKFTEELKIVQKLTEDHGFFMETARIISRLRDFYSVRSSQTPLDEKSFQIFKLKCKVVKIFMIFIRRPDVPNSKRLRAVGCVSDLLNEMLSNAYQPQWSEIAESTHPYESPTGFYEQARDLLRSSIDFEFVYHGIIRRANMSYRRALAASTNKEKSLASDLVNLAEACRFFWDPTETSNLVLENGHFDLILKKSHRIYLHNRLLGLFLHPKMCHEKIIDGSLFNYWASSSYSQIAASWHATFLNLLARGMKYGWTVGRPVIGEVSPRLKLISTYLLYQLIKIPLSQTKISVTFYEDKVPNDYSFITDIRPPNAVKSTSKIIVLSLMPFSSTNSKNNENNTSDEQIQREWDFKVLDSVDVEDEPSAQRSGFDVLKLLVNSIGTFTHPSYSGRFTVSIADFINHLVSAYLSRVIRERSLTRSSVGIDKLNNSKSIKLGPKEDQYFIDLLLPVCAQGLYCKSQGASELFEKSLVGLCSLNPSVVCSILMNRFLPTLCSDTQSEQTIYTMRFLVRLMPYIVKYNAENIPALLDACVPGIDPVDSLKTIQTFVLVQSLTAYVPVMDLSTADYFEWDWEGMRKTFCLLEGYPEEELDINKRIEVEKSYPVSCFRNYPLETLSDLQKTKSIYNDCEMFKEMIEKRLLATQALPSFVSSFLERVLEYISVSSSEKDGSADNLGSAIMTIAGGALSVMVQHCDEELHKSLVDRVLKLITQDFQPNAMKLVQQLVMGLSSRNPIYVRNKLLTICLKNILKNEKIDSNLGDEKIGWFMNVICGSIRRFESAEMLTHRNDFEKLIILCLSHSTKSVSKWGVKLMRRIVENVTSTEPRSCEVAVLSPTDCESEIVMQSSIFRWGMPFWLDFDSGGSKFNHQKIIGIKLKEQKIEWVVPQEEEIKICLEMISNTLIAHCVLLDCHQQNYKSNKKNENKSIFEDLQIELLKMSGSNNSPVQAPPLNTEQLKSPFHSFLRIVSILRLISKSFSQLFVNDFTPHEHLHPTISEINVPIVSILIKYVGMFIRSSAQKFIHLNLSSNALDFSFEKTNQEKEDQSESGLEDAKAMRKLLMLGYQVLCPRTGVTRQEVVQGDLDTWKYLVRMMSDKTQRLPLGLMEDMCRSWWVSRVFLGYVKHVEGVKQGIRMTSDRWIIINFIVSLCLHFYAQTRKTAQMLCENVCLMHRGVRSTIAKYLIAKLGELVNADSGPSGISDVESIALHDVNRLGLPTPGIHEVSGPPSGAPPMIDEYDASSTTKNENHEASVSQGGAVSADETIAPFKKPIIDNIGRQITESQRTGLTYLLSQKPMIRRIVTNPELFGRLLSSLFSTFKNLVERPTVQARLLNLTELVIQQREDLIGCGYQEILNEELFSPILTTFEHSVQIHWRATFVGLTALTVILSDTIFRTAEDSNSTSAKIIERYGSQLLRTSAKSQYPPPVVALSVCCLNVFLKLSMKFKINLSNEFNTTLKDHNMIKNLFTSISLLHSQLHSTGDGKGSNDYLRLLLIDVVKIGRYWPVTRVLRKGKEFSLHSVLFAHTLTQFLYRNSTRDELWSLMRNEVIPGVQSLADEPLSERGSHSGVSECCGGILRASRLWSPNEIEEVWKILQPLMAKEIEQIDLDALENWIDGLRYVAHGLALDSKIRLSIGLGDSPSNKMNRVERGVNPMATDEKLFPHPQEVIYPLINFIISPSTPVSSTRIAPFPDISSDATSQVHIASTVNSQLKMLELLYVMLPDVLWHIPEFDKQILDSLIHGLSFPYTKVRESVSRVLYKLMTTVTENRNVFEQLGSDLTMADVAVGRVEEMKKSMILRFGELRLLIREDAEKHRDRAAGDVVPSFINELEGLAKLFIFTFLSRCGKPLLDISYKYIPLAFDCLSHPSNEVKNGAWTSTAILCLSETLTMDVRVLRQVLNEVFLGLHNASWRVKTYAVRIVEMVLSKNRAVLLYYPQTEMILINFLIQSLDDPQIEVQNIAAIAVSMYAPLFSDAECSVLVKKFLAIAGNPRPTPTELAEPNRAHMMRGIFGLAALIAAFPYTVPKWLPRAVCSLAYYANDCQSDSVRSVVEKSLQSFCKSHQDAWESEHACKFTAEQKEVLESFKGRPVYFA